MDERGIPIDSDAFVVHTSSKYTQELQDIMAANDFNPDRKRQGRDRGENRD